MIRVVVAASYPVVRHCLQDALTSAVELEVVAAAADAEEVLAATDSNDPDVVLLGLAVPGADRDRATAAIRAAHPDTAVIVLGDSAEARDVLVAVEAGAAGYLLKDIDPTELVGAVRAAAAGLTPLSPRAAKALLALGPHRARADQLTPRGREVIALLGQGLSNGGIARRLGIAEKTVKAHLTRAFEHIGVADRLEAALWAQTTSAGLDPIECDPVSR